MYKQAFFSTEFVATNPDKAGISTPFYYTACVVTVRLGVIQQLRDALERQLMLLEKGLTLHRSISC
jgi:hypothetical protein